MKIEPQDQSSAATATLTAATVAQLYLRAEQVIQILPVSRRTISNWQARRLIRFYRVGRTVLFKRADIETCLEKYAVAAIGQVKPRNVASEPPVSPNTTAVPPPVRKRRMERIATVNGGGT